MKKQFVTNIVALHRYFMRVQHLHLQLSYYFGRSKSQESKSVGELVISELVYSFMRGRWNTLRPRVSIYRYFIGGVSCRIVTSQRDPTAHNRYIRAIMGHLCRSCIEFSYVYLSENDILRKQ